MNEIVTHKAEFSLSPKDLDQALKFADLLSKSNMVPKEFVGNPGNILVAIQWGMELGLQPMQAMQNIAVINGRPSLWGDSVIGLVKASPLCEYIIEETTDDEATCIVKRRGEQEQRRTFTTKDAKQAGLLGKSGPWTNYPKRMMQMRARSWALRDVFPDVLRGMPIAEEVMDIEPRDITPTRPTSESVLKLTQSPFEAEHLPTLQLAAETGLQSLQDAFAKVPAGKDKNALWKTHGPALKIISEQPKEKEPAQKEQPKNEAPAIDETDIPY